jgi:hypothetical protein
MTASSLTLLVQRTDVSNAVRLLREVEGIQVQIASTQQQDGEVPNKQGFRTLDFSTLVPIIIGITGASASLMQLAKAIIELKNVKAAKKEGAEQVGEIYLLIDNRRIVEVNLGIDAENLNKQISSELKGRS